jgi:hypothetical protein
MEPSRRVSRLFTRISEAARSIAGKFRREKPPGKIGTPPRARGPIAIPDDPGEHAKDFAERYWELLEAIARKRMRELGVPEDRIGMLDVDNDFRLAAFHTKRLEGGGVHPPTGRINLDAGLFKPDLLVGKAPPDVSSLYARSRASVRQDAVIAHEYEEGVRGSHQAAEQHAPDTTLAIKKESRRLLRAIRDRGV